ncbi:MAG: alanine--tRNA ligase [Pseudomonadales bacterium]|nr:alanine--tRNA ligase [Pseudomonadales bacterium]
MDSREIRQAFLDFFAAKQHAIVDSSSLVPDNDPTLLFTNAGMVQFKEALAFRENRGYTRAVSCQRCVRAGGKHNDLDNVGYTARHHTFFEMLGNFSFGDYFKRDAIFFAWEFLTEVVKLPPERLWVTVHESDDEAEDIWVNEIGFDKNRVTRLGDDDNFWTMGDTGPCGPSSEIFYDHGADVPGGPPGSKDGELDRYIEIWNLVFTQFDKSADGTLTPLPKPCVDTGMGFERLAAVLQGVHNNYDIDLFKALIARAGELLDCQDLQNDSLKVIADHIRASAFLIADGVLPSNEGRGYVMRRIIRRALRQGHKLQSKGPFFHKMVGELVNQMGDAYPILKSTQAQIEKVLLKEEEQFELTLDQGMKILNEAIGQLQSDVIPGSVVFKLYDTYGFPTDLTNDIAREKNLSIDMDGFEVEMEAQRERARAASKFGSIDVDNFKVDDVTTFVGYESLIGESVIAHLFHNEQKVESVSAGDEVVLVLNATPFYAESGGQAGDSGKLFTNGVSIVVNDTIKSGDAFLHKGTVIEGQISVGDSVNAEVDRLQRDRTRLNHSATHLLHAALRIVLGDHVNQRGSLVDAERMRFDFSHFEGVTKEELLKVELLVNEQIRGNSEIQTELMNLEDAREKGAMALFGEKYSEAVRVLTMGNGFSIELCGGTHASRTGDIGLMKITSEVGIASGVRRIEAVTGVRAFELVMQQEQTLEDFSALLRADKNSATDKLKSLLEQNKKLEKEVSQLNMKLASGGGKDLADSAVEINGVKVVAQLLEGGDAKTLPDAMDRVKNKLQSGVVLLAVINDDKVVLVAGVTKDLTDKVKAGDLLNYVATQVGGKGGGRPDMARGGGTDTKAVPAAIESVQAYLEERL